ncbi:MAG: MFS transporter, partial [Cyanobacteria bacterium J06598_3]
MAGKRILWLQVWGLAAIQGAISLTWVIYGLYLPDLLTQFGFAASLASALLILENILAAVMEPLMGSLSDRAQRFVTTSFPFISVGLVVASLCFIAIPGTLTFVNPEGLMRGLLPVVLVAWAIAMTIFRSPAMSLLGRYAFATELPLAASVLTLVGGVAGAMGPLASQFILKMGAIAAFGIGSFVLLAAAAALRATQPVRKIQSATDDEVMPSVDCAKLSWLGLACAFGTGIGVGLGFRLMLATFPKLLEVRVPDANVNLLTGCIFLALALTALPAGKVGTWLGNRIAMLLGLGVMAGLMSTLPLANNAIVIGGMAALWGAAFSLVANGT